MKMQRVKTLERKGAIESVITKGADGRRYMLIFTSNGYKDREDEHVRTAALQEYVDSCWSKGGQWIGDNAHLYWHVKQLHIGDIVWAGMLDGFLVEVSRERDTPIAKTVWDYLETTPIKHGASQGFRPLTAKTESGVYNHIRKFETSTLPLEFAANIGTLSEVIMVTKDIKLKGQASTLDEIFGIEGVFDILKKEGVDGVLRRLAAQGIQAKSLSPATVYKDALPDVPPNATPGDIRVANGLQQLINKFGLEMVKAVWERIAASNTSKSLDMSTLNALEKALDERLPIYDSWYPDMRIPLTAQQRAQDAAHKVIAATSPYDGFWRGLNVPKQKR